MRSVRMINPWTLAFVFALCPAAANAQCFGQNSEVICNSNIDIDSLGNIEAYSVTQIGYGDIYDGWEAQVFGYLYAPYNSSPIDDGEGDDDGWGYAEVDLYGVVTTPGTYEEDGEHYEFDPDDYYSEYVGESSDTSTYTGSCTFPTGEIPQDSGWAPGAAPARLFTMSLLGTTLTTTFAGRGAYEQWSGGDTYGCLGENLQNQMNTPSFPISSQNTYADTNGYAYPGWYNIVNGAPGSTFPCSYTVFQAMIMTCAGTFYTWTTNEIDVGVDTGTVTVMHEGAGGTYEYPD